MAINLFNRRWQPQVISCVALMGALVTGAGVAQPVLAQVIGDDTLGTENSVVTPDTIRGIPSDRIDGGAIRDANLFHSFLEFNIAAERGVYFVNPDGIENILSRVTGSNPSNILGRLGVLGEANLFLLNPNGILFGPNASLDIEGSFLGTTANSFTFPDGSEFSATNPQAPPILTISVPLGLQYGSNPGNVQVQGSNLQVNPGKTLALVGGNVSMDRGQLTAVGGRIELGGVAGTGTVELSAENTGNLLSLSFPDEVARADVSLTNQALVNVLAGGGGSIAVNAGNINMFARSRLAAGISQNSGSVGAVAGDITVDATGRVTLRESSLISNQVDPGGTGNSGNINLLADSLYLISGSQLFMSTFGQGNPGSLNVNVRDIVSVDSAGNNASTSGILNSFAGTGVGKGGDINITTGSLSVTNGAQLNAITFGEGDAGNVTINARDAVSIDGANVGASGILSAVAPNGIGNGGNINITTGSLSVTNGAQLNAITRGRGNAGNVTINARDRVSLDGQNQNNQAASAIFTAVGIGDDGTQAVGDGGDITITTESLSITGGAEVSALTRGQGNAGNVTINARDRVSLDGEKQSNGTPSQIFTSVASNEYSGYPNLGQAVGDAGNITITTGSLSITGGAALNALTRGQGNGGNVTINAREQVLIDGENSNGGASGVFSSVDVNAYTDQPPARGDGGDITISTGSLSITTGAGLFANTKGEGNGGNVIINARDQVLIDGENSNGGASGIFSSVDSNEYTQRSPARGDGGDITISTGSLSITTGAGLFALTKGQGNGGNVIINARDTVLIDGENSNGGASGVFSSVESNANTDQPPARGNAGDITITTNSLSVTNGGGLYALTAGQGNAGKVTIDARDRISFNGVNSNGGSSGVFSRVDTTGVGQGGDITITTGLLLVTGSAQLNTLTAGQGNAGNLSVTAPQAVILSDNSQLSVETRGVGQAGDVTVTTETLDIKDGTRISATATNTATPSARGGSINVNASTVNFSGQMNGLLAETEGVAPAGALTLQPFANGQNLTINLQDNAKISAATSGIGEGGSLSVTAPESITIRGQGQLSVETTGDGAAGNLTIDTQNLTITDGATISASTASPNPQGLGGNLTINATESFTLTNQARILAQSTGAAPAGTITVDSGQLTANNGSIETSATQSAGGAITITASDIRLFGDSDIRTDVASGVGGGGNITLTADTILAFADSDILAFAQDGKGGDITFNTPVFFGFAYTPAPKGTDPDTLDHNGRVDINATGAVEGVITLPDTSAVRNSLTPLSNNQIDTDKLIAESCIARRHEPKRGSFFITGTGGIPFRPGDLYVTPYQTGTVRSIPSERDGEAGEESSSTRRPWKIGDPIIEPTGIYRLANGELIMGRLCGE